MEELCKHCWLLSKVALPLSKFSTLGAQVTEFQSSLHSSLSFVQYSHRLGQKLVNLAGLTGKAWVVNAAYCMGFKWKMWRLLCQKMKKSRTWHFWVCRSTHTRIRVAGCYQCSKLAWIYSRSFLWNRFFFLDAKWRGLNNITDHHWSQNSSWLL